MNRTLPRERSKGNVMATQSDQEEGRWEATGHEVQEQGRAAGSEGLGEKVVPTSRDHQEWCGPRVCRGKGSENHLTFKNLTLAVAGRMGFMSEWPWEWRDMLKRLLQLPKQERMWLGLVKTVRRSCCRDFFFFFLKQVIVAGIKEKVDGGTADRCSWKWSDWELGACFAPDNCWTYTQDGMLLFVSNVTAIMLNDSLPAGKRGAISKRFTWPFVPQFPHLSYIMVDADQFTQYV